MIDFSVWDKSFPEGGVRWWWIHVEALLRLEKEDKASQQNVIGKGRSMNAGAHLELTVER